MGSLIVARHPALHSLAEVTIVGMFTVVLMAWFVPVYVFRWLVWTDGHPRSFPVTIDQIVRTTYCAICYLSELLIGCVLGSLLHLIPGSWKKKENWFHRVVFRIMQANIHHIWGVDINIHNDSNEKFDRGSILLCNHESILDPILLLAMSPKVLILISRKVWRNPIVYPLFRFAGFICLDQPIDRLEKDIKRAVDKGYNVVIFPEGKRSGGTISRFHKGAFHIAKNIGADVLTVFTHGVADVMPKGSGFATRGRIDVHIGDRTTAEELNACRLGDQQIAHKFHQLYVEKYTEMKRIYETTHYFHYNVISKYIYKGISVERETRHLLKKYNDFSEWIDCQEWQSASQSAVHILYAGKGQFSMLFALVHPQIEVHAYTSSPDDAALLEYCNSKPANLHVHLLDDAGQNEITTGGKDFVIDLSTIIKKTITT
jgi:1-acyl-sn-glycerol-3-phosphate acyltransferase